MRTSSHPASAVASLMLVLATAGPALAQTSPGWMYTMNTTIDSGGKRASMAMKYQVTERRLRMEFVQVSGMAAAGAAEGMSQILDDRDSSMTMVMPSHQMATVTHLSDVFGGASRMPTQMVPKVERHLTSSHLEDLGAGERILGHATHRYRVTTAGTLDFTIMGQTCSRRLDSTQELWMATDVDLLPVMQTMLNHYGSAMGRDFGSADVSTADAGRPPGTAMRTVSKSTGVDANGRVVPVTSTSEYVEISQAPIPNSVFEVPASYQKMDMRKMMADIPAGAMDSAMAHASTDKTMLKMLCGTGAP